MCISTLPSTSALDGFGWSTPRPGRFNPRKEPVPIVQEAGQAPGPVWTGAENLASYRDSIPGPSSPSEQLYRLSCPSPWVIYPCQVNTETIRPILLKWLPNLQLPQQNVTVLVPFCDWLRQFIVIFTAYELNPLTPNDPCRGRTAPLTSKRFILYIYSTNIGTEYFKHGINSPFFSLQNAVCFIILTYLVRVLFTLYIFIQQIQVLNILNTVYTLRFFLFKMQFVS